MALSGAMVRDRRVLSAVPPDGSRRPGLTGPAGSAAVVTVVVAPEAPEGCTALAPGAPDEAPPPGDVAGT